MRQTSCVRKERLAELGFWELCSFGARHALPYVALGEVSAMSAKKTYRYTPLSNDEYIPVFLSPRWLRRRQPTLPSNISTGKATNATHQHRSHFCCQILRQRRYHSDPPAAAAAVAVEQPPSKAQTRADKGEILVTVCRSTGTTRLGLALVLRRRRRRRRGRADGPGPRGGRPQRRTLERRLKRRCARKIGPLVLLLFVILMCCAV